MPSLALRITLRKLVGFRGVVFSRNVLPWLTTGWYTSIGPDTDETLSLRGRCILQRDAWAGGKYAAAYERASPCSYTGLAQLSLEPVLRRHAEALAPSGTVRFGLGVSDIKPGATPADRASVVLENGAIVKAKYVLCADGGRTCADVLGIKLEGPRRVWLSVNHGRSNAYDFIKFSQQRD